LIDRWTREYEHQPSTRFCERDRMPSPKLNSGVQPMRTMAPESAM
jgi:hypothetical protein